MDGAAEAREGLVSRDTAAVTIQRWYRRFKTVHSSAPDSKSTPEDSINIDTDNSLDDFVNNELAIALALVNQRRLSSLTESQQERVRQLRAEVAPKKNYIVAETTNNLQKSSKCKTSRLKPPSIKVRRKEIGATSIRTKDHSQANSTSSNISTKKSKLREPFIHVSNKGLNATEKCEQVGSLGKECYQQQENPFKTQQVQTAEQQETNTEKKSHQQRQNEDEPTTLLQSDGFRDHPSKIPMPTKQPTQPQLPEHKEYNQQEEIDFIELRTDGKVHPVRNEGTRFHQTDWNEPETPAESPRHPPPKKHQEAVKRLKQQEPPSHDSDYLQEPPSHDSDYLQEPPSHDSDYLQEPPSHDSDYLQEPPSHDSNYLQEKDLDEAKRHEQAQALINYAQELVIKDFLAWKGGSLSTIPINEHQRKVAPPQLPWDKATLAHSKVDNESELDNKTSPTQTQANRFSPIIENLMPHLTPTLTPTIAPLRLSPDRRIPKINHTPKSKGTMATNKVSAPPMSDIAIQTDSINLDDDILLILSAITLPPISDKGLKRPYNQGGNSRLGRRNGRAVESRDKKFEERGSFAEVRDRKVGPKNQPSKVKKEKHSMHYKEKKSPSLKSLPSPPPLRQTQNMQAGGYLTKFLHSDGFGHLPRKSAPGGYYQASSANQPVPWYEDLNYTTLPSIISGDSSLLNKSHPVPFHTRRKLRRLDERLKPIQQHPAEMYPHPTNLNNDPFNSLDSMYQHQYRKNSQRKKL